MTPTNKDVQAAYMDYMRYEMDDTVGHTANGPFFKAKREAYERYFRLKQQWEETNGQRHP